MRLAAYGVLAIVALNARSHGTLWQQGVSEFIAVTTQVAIAPVKAAKQVCPPADGPCQVQIAVVGGRDVCGLSEAQLRRKRRFQVALNCRFTWLPGVAHQPQLKAESYRLSLGSASGNGGDGKTEGAPW